MNFTLDGFGIYGMAMDYAVIFFFTGTALLLFIYLWKNQKLDMDEAPKLQMMQNEEKDGEF